MNEIMGPFIKSLPLRLTFREFVAGKVIVALLHDCFPNFDKVLLEKYFHCEERHKLYNFFEQRMKFHDKIRTVSVFPLPVCQ